jgi:hypothetical protein
MIQTGDGGNKDYSNLYCQFSHQSHNILRNIDKKLQNIKKKKNDI